jgi:hypothetical protein
MKKNLLFYSFIFVLFCHAAKAQKPLRVEIEAKSYSSKYNVLPIGPEGVLLFNESDEGAENGLKKWIFTKYDTNFKEVWTKEFPIDKKVSYKKFFLDKNRLYLLFIQGTMGALQIVDLDIKSGLIKSTNKRLEINSVINDFKVIGDDVYLGGNSVPKTSQIFGRMCLAYAGCFIPLFFGIMNIPIMPVLMNINLKTGTSKLLPLIYEGNSTVVDLNVNKAGTELEAGIMNSQKKGISHFYIKTYSAGGNLTNTTEIMGKNTFRILGGRIMSISATEKIIIGNYTPESKKQSIFTSLNTDYPAGFYFTKLTKNVQEYIQFYSFDKLLKFNTNRESKNGKGKDEKKEVLHYQLLVHDIIQKNNEYVMIAEAYYPEYHTEVYTEMVTNANGSTSMRTRTRQVFDGYRYTHAMVSGFDKNGIMLWYQTFEIMDILSFELTERVKVIQDGDKQVLVYSNGGAIKSKVINGKEIVEGKVSTKIENAYTADDVKDNYKSDIDYWYDKYFLAHGFQVIKNTEDSKKDKKNVKKKRTVFYFSKIGFQ